MIPPSLPPSAFKSYVVAAPLATHWSIVTCADYQCDAYLRGWDSVIDERTELGQRQAHYIRKVSGRRFTEQRDDAGLTVFTFEPGQQGFASRDPDQDHSRHKRRNMRPERYIERDGDFRGNPTGRRYVHARPDDWVESFQGHQERLKTIAERG